MTSILIDYKDRLGKPVKLEVLGWTKADGARRDIDVVAVYEYEGYIGDHKHWRIDKWLDEIQWEEISQLCCNQIGEQGYENVL